MKTFMSLCVFLSILCVGAAWASASEPFTLRLATNGDVSLGRDDVSLGLRIHKEGWTGTITGEPILDGGASSPSDPEVSFRMKDDSGAVCVTGRVELTLGGGSRFRATSDGDNRQPTTDNHDANRLSDFSTTASLTLNAVALTEIRAECVAMEFTIPARDIAGLEWRVGDTASGIFPEKYGDMRLWRGMADSFSYVDPETRKPVELRFSKPMPLVLQDSRLWVPDFSVRIELSCGDDVPVVASSTISFDCEISHPNGIAIERDEIVAIEAGEDWIPLDNRKNIAEGSALDFSFLSDAPAGKHGWLKAVDGHFEFEGLPGVEQRFYGVNLCETANFPDHAMAEELVTRLKRLGYNSIRFHHHDETWAENLDRFDYLAAVAISNGLYITTDLYVSRKVAWRDIGFDRDGFVPDNCFKSLVALHEPAFENWKAFAEAFLLHENPYTGRRYIDEPGMPLICLINEGPMKWTWNTIKKMDCVKEAWREWRSASLREKNNPVNPVNPVQETSACWASIPASPASIDIFADSAVAQCFAAEMERRAFEREKAFLVSIGCKALLTSQNCSDDQTMAYLRETYDYVDNHCYLDHPKFLGKLWSGAFRLDPGGNPVKIESGPLVNAAFTRIAGKPYTLTEWNLPGPGQYRGAGGLLMGAMASRQDWDGLWRFAYSHVERGLADGFGAPHLFDLSVDPVNQASERAVMALFMRGDMAPLKAMLTLDVGMPRITPDGKPAANRPEWMDDAWRLQVGRVSDKTNPVNPVNPVYKIFALDDVLSTPPVAPQDTPDFAIDREAGTVIVATPRTCGVFAEGGTHEAGALRVEIDNPATVFASSLDGKPLETSSRILVTHLTDAQAEGNVFADRARSILLKWGKGRTLVRSGAARVSLALAAPDAYEVWGLATDGTRMERVPATAENGRLSFTADVDSGRGARMHYEISRKVK